jgi:hypothetical protein
MLQPEALIQLADQDQPCVRRDMRALERDLQQAVERELKRLFFFFTHRVSPFVVGFLTSEPREIRARRMSRWVRYYGEIGNPDEEPDGKDGGKVTAQRPGRLNCGLDTDMQRSRHPAHPLEIEIDPVNTIDAEATITACVSRRLRRSALTPR